MNGYLDKSARAILATCLTFDYARSAEKMTDWHCVGEDNDAWKKGPYLSAGANSVQIDRSQPYCLRISQEFSVAGSIVLGTDPEKSESGGVKIPLPPKDASESRVEPVISKLAIIEQFELFKEFLVPFDGPFNKKKRREWEGRIDDEVLELLDRLITRRNELTHDSTYAMPSMKEAVEYFFQLRQIASVLYEESIKHSA